MRKFHSSEYLNALASGEICLVLGYSGDIKQAQKRAAEAKNGVEIGYAIPKERSAALVRQSCDPEGRKERRRGARTDQLSAQARRRGEEHQLHLICERQCGEPPADRQAIANDKTVYPDEATMKTFYTLAVRDQKTQRLVNRLWTKIKTGR